MTWHAHPVSERVLSVRRATVEDASEIGAVHVRAWQAGYADLMPADLLAGLEPDERAAMWLDHMSHASAVSVLVAVDGSQVVGFVAFGAENSTGPRSGCGEVYALNVDPSRWAHGGGRALLVSACEMLSALGYSEAVLWVLSRNMRARRLYESQGWYADGATALTDHGGATTEEIRYRTQLARSGEQPRSEADADVPGRPSGCPGTLAE